MAWTRALQTFLAADMRNPQRGGGLTITLPEQVLEPDETVYEILMCNQVGDSWPFLVITDRRVVHAWYGMFRGWRVRDQVPAPQVAGASFEKKWITGRVHVHRRNGKPMTVKVDLGNKEWCGHIVDLLDHLAVGGAPPRI